MRKGVALLWLDKDKDKDKTRQTRQLRARRSRLGREWLEKNVVSWHVLCRYELHERRALEWTAEIPSQYFDRSRFLRIEIAARARPARSSRPEVSVKSGPRSWEQFVQDRVALSGWAFEDSLEKLAMCQRCLPACGALQGICKYKVCIVYAFHGRDSEETRCSTYIHPSAEGKRIPGI